MLHIFFCVCFGIGYFAPLMKSCNDQIYKFNCSFVSFVCDGRKNKHIVIRCDVFVFAFFGFALDLVFAFQFIDQTENVRCCKGHCII